MCLLFSTHTYTHRDTNTYTYFDLYKYSLSLSSYLLGGACNWTCLRPPPPLSSLKGIPSEDTVFEDAPDRGDTTTCDADSIIVFVVAPNEPSPSAIVDKCDGNERNKKKDIRLVKLLSGLPGGWSGNGSPLPSPPSSPFSCPSFTRSTTIRRLKTTNASPKKRRKDHIAEATLYRSNTQNKSKGNHSNTLPKQAKIPAN